MGASRLCALRRRGLRSADPLQVEPLQGAGLPWHPAQVPLLPAALQAVLLFVQHNSLQSALCGKQQ